MPRNGKHNGALIHGYARKVRAEPSEGRNYDLEIMLVATGCCIDRGPDGRRDGSAGYHQRKPDQQYTEGRAKQPPDEPLIGRDEPKCAGCDGSDGGSGFR
jgi:hypothetical protein